MASNMISRLLAPGSGSPSVYETLQQHDESQESDLEERAGMSLDEANLGEESDRYELDHVSGSALLESRVTADDVALIGKGAAVGQGGRAEQSPRPPRWRARSRRVPEPDDGDDEVPLSLLTEDDALLGGTEARPSGSSPSEASPAPAPTAPARDPAVTSPAAPAVHRTYSATSRRAQDGLQRKIGLAMIDPKERALWRWANVENLDNFLKDVYDYFLGNGIWSIILSRFLNMLTLSFVVGFSTFLTMCIDYRAIPHSTRSDEIVIPQCMKKMSGSANLFLWLFALAWVAKAFQYILDIRRLQQMHDFYLHLLDVNDSDIQTVSWQDIVARLMALRDANPVTADGVGSKSRRFMGNQSKQRMDAHDIANRLMRKENYLIALFNKDILDLTLPIPFLRNRQLFSKTLEWNLNMCILDYVFNDQGQVRPLFLRDTHRRKLSDGLRRRFLFAGTMNVICAPFIVIYLSMLYFFRYFTEYQRNPSQIGSRQYTPLAEWKFREFNELWHLFQRRINMSYPFASRYVNQFPKDKTVQLSRFVAFVTGALAAVLALASVIDPELFLGFEITPERTVLFYLGVFGTIWAVARGVVPEETLVFDPEYALNDVIQYTRYVPAPWRGRLHSNEVRTEFAALYQMKVIIFLEELLSIIFTPFVLWFSLPKCSDRLVDFFREFTVHVDGLGYVCSFAVFDFKKGASQAAHSGTDQAEHQGLRDEYYATKDGKMMASYFGFLDNYTINPRAGGGPSRHTTGRRNPYPRPHPPPFLPERPALPQEIGTSDARRAKMADRLAMSTNRAIGGSVIGMASTHRLPRGPTSGPVPLMSPMPSMLLDPHHQPLTPGPPGLTKRVSLAKKGAAARLELAQEEIEDGDESLLPTSQPGMSAHTRGSGGLGEDSNLGESWKTTQATALDDDDDEEEDLDTVTGEKGTGVLGLLYQFQKAQSEGRGTGVNI